MFNHDRDTKSKIKSPCQFKERKKIRQINASQKENMTPSIGLNLRVTGYCNQGGRKYMEDVFRYVLLKYKTSNPVVFPCGQYIFILLSHVLHFELSLFSKISISIFENYSHLIKVQDVKPCGFSLRSIHIYTT